MSSIEEVKARLIQLVQDVPVSLLDQVNNEMVDIIAAIKGHIAGTNNSELEQALARLEQGHTVVIDGAIEVVNAGNELRRAAEQM